MGTALTGIVLVGITAIAIRKVIRNKKNGKSLSCGGDCSRCSGHCR